MIERDYIMRMIQQFTQVLLRVLKLEEDKQYEAAQRALNGAFDELFGIDGQLLRRMDSATVARLLAERDKIKIVAKLYAEEGKLWTLRGDDSRAEAQKLRALELYLEALACRPEKDPESVAAIRTLATKTVRDLLSEEYTILLCEYVDPFL